MLNAFRNSEEKTLDFCEMNETWKVQQTMTKLFISLGCEIQQFNEMFVQGEL